MDATALGLWLIGVGAAASIAALSLEPAPLGRGGMTFNSPERAKRTRIRQAVQLIAALLVASGSIVVAAAQTPPWWIVAATAIVVLAAIWLHCAWSQNRLWKDKFAPLARTPLESVEKQGLQAQYATAKHCARWSWALCHPFNGETWPESSLKPGATVRRSP